MSGRIIVPFVPTPEAVVHRMLAVANVKPGEIVYDLGAGDGRIIATAARDFNAKAVGVELQDSRYQLIAERIHMEGLDKLASAIKADFLNVDLSNANVVTLYLLNSVNSLIRPKLERELKPGARIVSHDFPIQGWKPVRVEKIWAHSNSHLIYLYELPTSLASHTKGGRSTLRRNLVNHLRLSLAHSHLDRLIP
jgi:ubiquinone/menaquinone biosynthesis C-methylase UbiE